MKKLFSLLLMVWSFGAFAQIPMTSIYDFQDTVYFTQIMDTTSSNVNDSNCVFWDGVNGNFFYGTCPSGGGGGANFTDSTRLVRDSVLIYWLNGTKIDSQTVRLTSQFPTTYWSLQGDTILRQRITSDRVVIGDKLQYIVTQGHVPQLTVSSNGAPVTFQMLSDLDAPMTVQWKFSDADSYLNLSYKHSSSNLDTLFHYDLTNFFIQPYYHQQSQKSFSSKITTKTISGVADTTFNIQMQNNQGAVLTIDSSVTGVLINFDTLQTDVNYIQDYSLTIITDTSITPPTLHFTAGKFQFAGGAAPTLTTTKTDAQRRDILTFRYDGAPTKRLKVLAVQDFQNN